MNVLFKHNNLLILSINLLIWQSYVSLNDIDEKSVVTYCLCNFVHNRIDY